MNNISEVYESVVAWNEKRYERVYNSKLLVELLNEEIQEFYDAETKVEKLDALCDTIYVALGGLWKLGTSDEDNQYMFDEARQLVPDIVNSAPIPCISYSRAYVDCMRIEDSGVSHSFMCHMVISCCFYECSSMGLTVEQVNEALGVVCKSNDSKSIKRTNSDTKANDGDKGNYYVSPTVGLTKILGEVHANHH